MSLLTALSQDDCPDAFRVGDPGGLPRRGDERTTLTQWMRRQRSSQPLAIRVDDTNPATAIVFVFDRSNNPIASAPGVTQ